MHNPVSLQKRQATHYTPRDVLRLLCAQHPLLSHRIHTATSPLYKLSEASLVTVVQYQKQLTFALLCLIKAHYIPMLLQQVLQNVELSECPL